MNLEQIHNEYDKLQAKFSAKGLRAIYGGGYLCQPEILFIFMNPTATNLASFDSWRGINAPFIGSKNAWKVFNRLGLLSSEVLEQILLKKPKDWDVNFANFVYDEVKKNKFYITNLAKCTQADASSLKDDIFKEYLQLLELEISVINPKKIVCFGNQVSSLFLNKNIEVKIERPSILRQ